MDTNPPSNLRGILKTVRDEKKTPYDCLPDGRTIGDIANELALRQYSQKILKKRERARQLRQRKRQMNHSSTNQKMV